MFTRVFVLWALIYFLLLTLPNVDQSTINFVAWVGFIGLPILLVLQHKREAIERAKRACE
jgi:uncharacterized integral membrane protein